MINDTLTNKLISDIHQNIMLLPDYGEPRFKWFDYFRERSFSTIFSKTGAHVTPIVISIREDIDV